MAHAYTNTLLAKLGFADPDKGNPRHDLACQYVARAEVVDALKLYDNNRKLDLAGYYLEQPISKGTGQYKTTIGFIDTYLVVGYKVFKTVLTGKNTKFNSEEEAREAWKVIVEKPYNDYFERIKYGLNLDRVTNTWEVPEIKEIEEDWIWAGKQSIFIEVKIKPVGIGDILRQINLYRSYIDFGRWVLVTDFDMSANMEEELEKMGVKPLRLGSGFDSFIEQQKFSTRPGSAQII